MTVGFEFKAKSSVEALREECPLATQALLIYPYHCQTVELQNSQLHTLYVTLPLGFSV